MTEEARTVTENDRLMYELAEQEIYLMCLKHGIRYFGPYLHARQGSTRRHIYMQALVESAAKQRPNDFIRVLEIGAWAGGSTITWATSLLKYAPGRGAVVAVDPWAPFGPQKDLPSDPKNDRSIYGIMKHAAESGEIIKLFQHNIRCTGVRDIVMPFQGLSDQILPLFGDNSFDIVYIDGAHDYDSVTRDLRNSRRLVKEGGYLCGDDLELQLHQVDQEFNRNHIHGDYLEDPLTKESYHPGVCRAVAEAFGAVSCFEGLWAAQKQGNIWGSVDLPQAAERFEVPSHLVESILIITTLMRDAAKSRGL